MGLSLSKLLGGSVAEILNPIGKGVGSVMNRLGFVEKLSEFERIDKYVKVFGISEGSTESAREMFMTEMRTQKQSWLIRFLNGLVRPIGGLGALFTEFYAIWGENLGVWFDLPFRPVTISVEQHLVLGAIIAFYFGSRLKETLSGVATTR